MRQENGLEITTITPAERDCWNAFVSQWPDFELMQSYEWGVFKEVQGWKVVRLGVKQNGRLVAGAQMLVKPLGLGLSSIAYIPRGPLLAWKDKAVRQVLLSALHTLARRHRAILLKIEPPIHCSPGMMPRLRSYGFHRSDIDNQPQCSMLIDLTPDLDTVLANMHKTTRYNIRYSARKGVVVREGGAADLDTFYRLLDHTAQRAGFSIRSREYYRQEWHSLAGPGRIKLFLALYGDEVLAARLPAAFGGKAATLHSGSYDTLRNLKPNELLMWESLKWAKDQGCTAYDVWGIPSEVGAHVYLGQPLPKEQQEGLWSVYRFKRGFGGKVVYYVGAYDYVYSRPLYWLLTTIMKRLGSLETLMEIGDRF